jgi:hypothetical protein
MVEIKEITKTDDGISAKCKDIGNDGEWLFVKLGKDLEVVERRGSGMEISLTVRKLRELWNSLKPIPREAKVYWG